MAAWANQDTSLPAPRTVSSMVPVIHGVTDGLDQGMLALGDQSWFAQNGHMLMNPAGPQIHTKLFHCRSGFLGSQCRPLQASLWGANASCGRYHMHE